MAEPRRDAELLSAKWDAEYWHYLALTKRRVWWLAREWRHWAGWRIYLGGDEYGRRTVVVGPVCIALWMTREARQDIDDCVRAMDRIEAEEEAARHE